MSEKTKKDLLNISVELMDMSLSPNVSPTHADELIKQAKGLVEIVHKMMPDEPNRC